MSIFSLSGGFLFIFLLSYFRWQNFIILFFLCFKQFIFIFVYIYIYIYTCIFLTFCNYLIFLKFLNFLNFLHFLNFLNFLIFWIFEFSEFSELSEFFSRHGSYHQGNFTTKCGNRLSTTVSWWDEHSATSNSVHAFWFRCKRSCWHSLLSILFELHQNRFEQVWPILPSYYKQQFWRFSRAIWWWHIRCHGQLGTTGANFDQSCFDKEGDGNWIQFQSLRLAIRPVGKRSFAAIMLSAGHHALVLVERCGVFWGCGALQTLECHWPW